MRASCIILLAILFNFFGGYIVNYYVFVSSLNVTTIFSVFSEDYYYESLVELLFVFLFILLFYLVSIYLNRGRGRTQSSGLLNPSYNSYLFFVLIFLILSIDNYLNINWTFSYDNRGVGQFERDFSSALSRLTLLVFPLFVFFGVVYRGFNYHRLVCFVFLLSVILLSLSTGDRRMMVYYLIYYAFYSLRFYRQGVFSFFLSRSFIFFIVTFSILVFSYYLRASDLLGLQYLMLIILSSTFGALGIAQILSQVKYYVHNSTGYLLGEPFINYSVTLFAPSFILYLIGFDEFYLRSSLLFNSLFNDNPNMGYDFMMIADFYWSFSYFGYLLYILLCCSILYYVCAHEKSSSDYKFCMVVILSVYFIAGQRSDFGYFLKSFFYSYVLFKVLWFFMRCGVSSERRSSY